MRAAIGTTPRWARRWQEEPVARLRRHLAACHGWGKREEEEVLTACAREVDAAVDAYLALPPQAPESIFEHLFATLPPALAAQREALLAAAAEEQV